MSRRDRSSPTGNGDASDPAPDRGFVDFYRRYARTWVHAVAVAGMTALGTLTILDRWFAALALAAYVIPPVALYLSRTRRATTEAGRDAGARRDGEAAAPSNGAGGRPASSDAGDGPAWQSADSPVDATLFDVAAISAGAYAVGAGGVALADRGDGWDVALADGPGADSRTLRGVAATAEGSALWVAGDGGALARLDAASGRHTDFSAPAGLTDAWTDVAVGGGAGGETLLLVNGSGQVLRGQYRDGELAWSSPEKPGGGSSLTGADLVKGSVGYLCDSNDGVFETTDGGGTFRRVGLEAADGTLTDVAAVDRGDCLASADDGTLHRFDGQRWTPERLDDGPARAVARRRGYAVAAGDGAVYERADATGGWERIATPTNGALRGVAVGAERALAVGDDGTIVQRRR